MKILSASDPRLTSYALGELDSEDCALVEFSVSQSAEVRGALSEAREVVAFLSGALAEDKERLTPKHHEAIQRAMRIEDSAKTTELKPRRSRRYAPLWGGVGIAAAVALIASYGGLQKNFKQEGKAATTGQGSSSDAVQISSTSASLPIRQLKPFMASGGSVEALDQLIGNQGGLNGDQSLRAEELITEFLPVSSGGLEVTPVITPWDQHSLLILVEAPLGENLIFQKPEGFHLDTLVQAQNAQSQFLVVRCALAYTHQELPATWSLFRDKEGQTEPEEVTILTKDSRSWLQLEPRQKAALAVLSFTERFNTKVSHEGLTYDLVKTIISISLRDLPDSETLRLLAKASKLGV